MTKSKICKRLVVQVALAVKTLPFQFDFLAAEKLVSLNFPRLDARGSRKNDGAKVARKTGYCKGFSTGFTRTREYWQIK